MCANARLCPLGPCQLGGLQRTLVVGKCRLWPDNLMQVAVSVQKVSTGTFPCRQRRLVELRDIGAHADVLTALTWEQ